MTAVRRRCAKCGRSGSRGFTTATDGTVRCAKQSACQFRQHVSAGLVDPASAYMPSRFMQPVNWGNHPPCAGGCGRLADECICADIDAEKRSPLTIAAAVGSTTAQR